MTLVELFDWATPALLTFLATLTRVGLIFIFLPIWGDAMVPAKVKIMLILSVSMALTPVVRIDLSAYPSTVIELLYALGVEATFAFSIGFLVRLVISAVLIAGQIAGEQMGFAIANILAPDQSSQVTVVTTAVYVFAILLFFAMDFHLFLFLAIAQSFDLVPVFQAHSSQQVFETINAMIVAMFTMGIKMSAPVLATMIFVNVALGLINKAAPQVNVFIESFPIRIIMGLFMLSSVVVAMARLLRGHYMDMDRALAMLIRGWA